MIPRPMLSTTEREPAVTVASLTALAAAVVALLIAFGVSLTKDQEVAILALVAVLAPFLVGLLTRPRVTPNGRVVEVVRDDGIHVAGPASPLPTGLPIGPPTTADPITPAPTVEAPPYLEDPHG